LAEHEDGQQPAYDRWSRPEALSKRGYVLAVAVPVLIAACGFGAVSLFASDDGDLSGTTVRIPVSNFAPGDGSDDALIQGVLRLDSDYCVYLEAGQDGADPGRVVPVWPTGYRASREGDRLTVFDDEGDEVAHDGEEVRAGGGFTAAGTFAGEPCLPESGEVAVIQTDIEVLSQGQ
jgi:hypothetical protein